MKAISALLGEQKFFANLPHETLELLGGCGHNMHFDEGSRIINANESADYFYVLRSGKVSLEVDTPNRGPLVIETIGAGDLLGVSWLLPPYEWTFSARAIEPTSAIAVDAGCLRGKCDDDPALGYEMFKRFASLIRNRLQATRLQLVDVYGHDTF